MKSLQKKILAYIILIGVIPMIFIGSIYYHSASDKADERIKNESYHILERIEGEISSKSERLQKAAAVLFADKAFQKLLRDTELSNESGVRIEEIDNGLEKMFRAESKLETIVLFTKNGGVYTTGKPLVESSPARFVMEYGRISENAGEVSWQEVKPENEAGNNGQKIVAGTMIRDTLYLKDQEYLASMYMIFSQDLFEDWSGEHYAVEQVAATDSEGASEEKEEQVIYVYKGGGSDMIYSIGAREMGNLLERLSLREAEIIYGSDEGKTDFFLDGTHYVAVFYTARDSWDKYIRVVPYSLYYSNYQYIAYATILCILAVFALWCAINYLIIRKMTLPMREIVQAMKDVEEENLDVKLAVHSNDEFGIISRQFNNMLSTIKNLLERVRTEEKKRKESDVLMLQYQMNPHFLYNTLAAIRMEAIINKQHNIDKMLLILGRFLRNTIVRGTDLTTIEEEMSNISDYISLMQLRYKNQIQTVIEIDEFIKNKKIPGMLIQPIIENAVMHGLNDRFDSEQTAELKISVKRDAQNIVIMVFDNGKGMSEDEILRVKAGFLAEDDSEQVRKRHIGLSNIHRRVTMMFGSEFGVDIKSKKGEYTEISVKLPLIEE